MLARTCLPHAQWLKFGGANKTHDRHAKKEEKIAGQSDKESSRLKIILAPPKTNGLLWATYKRYLEWFKFARVHMGNLRAGGTSPCALFQKRT
jgi:hypothetical protein